MSAFLIILLTKSYIPEGSNSVHIPSFSSFNLLSGIDTKYIHLRAPLVVQMVKNLPAVRETWVRSLGREDPWRRA